MTLRLAVEILRYVSLVAYVVLALVTINQWRRQRDRAAAWAALCFGTLGLVVVLGQHQIVPEHPSGFVENFLQRLDIAILLLFPYLLYRFTTVFRTATSSLESALGLMTVVMIVWTFALPHIPEPGEPRSGLFIAYLVAFLIHWTVLSSVAATRLWRAGRGQPAVARRRMRILAFAAALLTIALFAAAATSRTYSVLALVSSALGIASALAFLIALAPPAVVRMVWRRPAQERVQDAVRDLITLSRSQAEVAQRVLGPMADIVGARALCLRNNEGDLIGSYGLAEGEFEPVHVGDAQQFEVEIPSGLLTVWASPYSPFFGREELRLLETVGAFTGLALDRVRLFQHEHEARLALERADEIKTNFIALASHELRTPVTTILGLATTLNRRGDELDDRQRHELRDTLERQADRMAKLVEQLLDLSRLDADAITISPEQINLRERIEEIVASVAGERRQDVQVRIDPGLEAPADPGALDRIVGNLVANALRYGMPPVNVDAVQHDRHLRVSVEDHGDGVPPQFVPQLFERFTRSRERFGGTGLGLAIARSYARAHDGDLVYEDVDPHGARFQLVLPVKQHGTSEPAEVELDAEAPPEVEAHGRRIFGLRRVR
ncbi:MAG TPA: HAMP domain-containing sensor histidine kinase [Gaiellaceae bacterium]|nr:HAMP domain-containing sensor histidine kinase [Gaiellaceae bacterium]